MPELELSVSEFVALLNQTLEYAYPSVTIIGELANFRVSKNRWIYFDLKDDESIVHFFGTVYQLPGPLEDGLLLKVRAAPRMHPQYGFSLTVQHMEPSGEGAIKKAASLLEAKLAAEGLFDPDRKRSLPYPPASVGLIASLESAAYSDFIKVLGQRWGGVEISLIDVQVQGELAAEQITSAIESFNQQPKPPEVLVITRGGGSAEDLQAFSTEQVTRAVAASRMPTLVAIGHERDLSLAELAADQRASTPSNAAELLVPDRAHVLAQLSAAIDQLQRLALQRLEDSKNNILRVTGDLFTSLEQITALAGQRLTSQAQLLQALNPQLALKRGFVLVRKGGKVVRAVHSLAKGDIVDMAFADGSAEANIQSVKEV